MIDIKKIRNNPKEVQEMLRKKGVEYDFEEFLSKDEKCREIRTQNDNLKNEKNQLSKHIGELKRNKQDSSSFEEQVKNINVEIAKNEVTINELNSYIKETLDYLPNPPAEDVVAGGKENNAVVKTVGTKPVFDFDMKDHVELAEKNNLIDYGRGTKLSGNGFWVYRNDAAKLEWALINYFIDRHLSNGYELVFVPHILNKECGYVAGQFPKFTDEVFYINEGKQFIIPTSETALVNLHRDEILKEDDLPLRYCSFTPCYRKEAGSYRKEERGMIRGHQFNKVELVQYAHPDKSKESFEEMLAIAESLVKDLGLHYQVSKLAAEDCSWSMATTYDIEVWIPSMGIYKEVSSVSNSFDYQARRGNVRFRNTESKQIDFIHTLNASGLATSRVLPAIFEQFQQEDGRIKVPEVLRKWISNEYLG